MEPREDGRGRKAGLTDAELEDDDDGEDGPDGVADDIVGLPEEDEKRDEREREPDLRREDGLPRVGPRERPELLHGAARGIPPAGHRGDGPPEKPLLWLLPLLRGGGRECPCRGEQRHRGPALVLQRRPQRPQPRRGLRRRRRWPRAGHGGGSAEGSAGFWRFERWVQTAEPVWGPGEVWSESH